jgi:hypothetical protein
MENGKFVVMKTFNCNDRGRIVMVMTRRGRGRRNIN